MKYKLIIHAYSEFADEHMYLKNDGTIYYKFIDRTDPENDKFDSINKSFSELKKLLNFCTLHESKSFNSEEGGLGFSVFDVTFLDKNWYSAHLHDEDKELKELEKLTHKLLSKLKKVTTNSYPNLNQK